MMFARHTLSFLVLLAVVLAGCTSPSSPTTAPTQVAVATATPALPVVTSGNPTPTATAPTATRPATAAKRGGVLNLFHERDPQNWDGWTDKGGNRDLRTRHNLVFSMLFTYPATPETNCRSELTPELVQGWQWVGDSVLELEVRQGVRFQNKPPVNGRELTASDVAASLDGFLRKNVLGGLESVAPLITGVEASDKYTVRIRTAGPVGSLVPFGLTSTGGAVILPSELINQDGTWKERGYPPEQYWIGTGPFAISEYVAGVRVVYDRHPGYFKAGLPHLQQVRQLVIPDLTTRAAALRSGKIDLIHMLATWPMADSFRNVPGFQVQSCVAPSGPGHIYMRTDQPPWNDVRVRRALSMALNRQGMVDAILQGNGLTAPLFPPEASPYHVGWGELPPEVKRWVTYDPQGSKKLLAEAGYPNGFTAKFYGMGWPSPYPEVIEAALDHWEAVGIKADIRWYTGAEWTALVSGGTRLGVEPGKQDTFQGFTIGPANAADLLGMASRLQSKSPIYMNRSRIKDPETDRLIDAFMKETDVAKAQQLYKQLEMRAIDQAWLITTGTFPMDLTIKRDYVKDFRGGNYYYMSTFVERIWLDK